MTEAPRTGLRCPACKQDVALLEDVQPDSPRELAFHCPACGHRWIWREGELPSDYEKLVG
jgi:predicted RNA-binding Zn-ribbon protein involved in translation (DUF1610 family)